MIEKTEKNLHHAKHKNLEQLILGILQLGILDVIGDGVNIVDTDFKIVYQNQAHKNIVGDHSGKYCYEAYRRRDRVCDGCLVAESYLDGGVHMVSRRATVDNKEVYFDITASPIRDSEGKIVAGIEIVRDITKRKRSEEKVKDSVKDLESFYDMAIGRETKMIKLKQKIEKLTKELAQYKKIQETD